ncbi:hypothetical protein [uncultured Methylobacterium sp.]|uniref:hypothetical protein n=1 Tax=uncultured Methylobacterium sp. TaxID=157278 RepID=UPI0035CABA92
MAAWFASGRIIDAILVLVALEAVALLVLRRRAGRGPAPAKMLCNLASGASLMLAVRAGLVGADWPVVALCLMAALAAHLGELSLRLRRRPARALGRSHDGGGTGTLIPGSAFKGHARN